MEELEFADWWTDFELNHKSDKDGGHYFIKCLINNVCGFSLPKRIAFIDELIQSEKIVEACSLIELYGNDRHKKYIRKNLEEWMKSNCDDLYGAVYVNTVLKTYEKSDYYLIRKYFLESNDFGSYIPLELFYVDRLLFLKTFEKKIRDIKNEIFYQSDNFLYLTNDIEVLIFLFENLTYKDSKRIQKFCKYKSTHSCISLAKSETLLNIAKSRNNIIAYFYKKTLRLRPFAFNKQNKK